MKCRKTYWLRLEIVFAFIAAFSAAVTSSAGTHYDVYGGNSFSITESSWWEKGYNPENYGYTFLGHSDETATFSGSHKFYIIRTPKGNVAPVDTVQGSSGSYFETHINGNTLQRENVGGAPDGQCALVGGLYWGESLGFIVIDASAAALSSITVCLGDINQYVGTIEGTVSYTGSQSGVVYVVVFPHPFIEHDNEIVAKVTISSPGSFRLSGMYTGTYYLAAVIMTDDYIGNGPERIRITDPWGTYGTFGAPTQVIVRAGQTVSSNNFMLVDGTEQNPNPWGRSIPLGPTVKANGIEHNVTVTYPDAMAVTIEMNADRYAGVPADWWMLSLAGSSWYYLNSDVQWTQWDGNISNCHPFYQGGLFNLPAYLLPELNAPGLPVSSYKFWLMVDSQDGILNTDELWADAVNVTLASALPAPCIKANGATGIVTVNSPGAVSITIELDAGAYAGIPADWWVLLCAGSSWYYLDSAVGWTQGDWSPVHQGTLGNLPALEVLNIAGLGAGSYTFYFAVDLPMNGILNMEQVWVDAVTVNVRESSATLAGDWHMVRTETYDETDGQPGGTTTGTLTINQSGNSVWFTVPISDPPIDWRYSGTVSGNSVTFQMDPPGTEILTGTISADMNTIYGTFEGYVLQNGKRWGGTWIATR